MSGQAGEGRPIGRLRASELSHRLVAEHVEHRPHGPEQLGEQRLAVARGGASGGRELGDPEVRGVKVVDGGERLEVLLLTSAAARRLTADVKGAAVPGDGRLKRTLSGDV